MGKVLAQWNNNNNNKHHHPGIEPGSFGSQANPKPLLLLLPHINLSEIITIIITGACKMTSLLMCHYSEPFEEPFLFANRSGQMLHYYYYYYWGKGQTAITDWAQNYKFKQIIVTQLQMFCELIGLKTQLDCSLWSVAVNSISRWFWESSLSYNW